MDRPRHEEKRHIFERHFLLGKLSRDEIDTLLHSARVERYPAGHEIYAKGSPGQSLMAVSSGTVKMTSVSIEGKEIVFNIVHPGDIFGEIVIPRSASTGRIVKNTGDGFLAEFPSSLKRKPISARN